MVFDLKEYNSHPKKPLSKHILGVLKKAQRRNKNMLLEVAILFHDLGKINPNFQIKLKGLKTEKYSQHAYLSAYAFLKFWLENEDYFKKTFSNDINWLRSMVAIVARHHGNLPNFDKILKERPLKDLDTFLKDNENLPLARYLKEELNFDCKLFDLRYDEGLAKFASFQRHTDKISWQKNALDYFTQTQFDFSCLIEADKRDAGKNENNLWWVDGKSYSETLSNSLKTTFDFFSKGEISDLNKIRTQLREDAEATMNTLLDEGQRTFDLTAPTGAGKTFTLLSVAKEIQKRDSSLGVIYCLPFLSITEQVEAICTKDLALNILSATSKSENKTISEIQESLDGKVTDEKIKRLLQEIYKVNTFDHPFVITTFVQFFETLVSNRNSTLLKLPNFANRIFLIDEIQSLPPRLYIFFSAWIDDFCKKNNSYAIFSSATMPYFKIPKKNFGKVALANQVFKEYNPPKPILTPNKYFSQSVFNRYDVFNLTSTPFMIEELAQHILKQEKSCLVILNTIEDTKLLFNQIENKVKNLMLLNTHFTPLDRLEKIRIAKDFLKKNEKVVLISTQLIEAGVDISFPIAYRDLCPLPSLIQSAGRCNRNGDPEKGIVNFIELHKEKNGKIKISAESIYRDWAGKDFLKFVKEKLPKEISETDLFEFQKTFFKNEIGDKLSIGNFKYGENQDANMLDCISNAEFETLGKFKLIREQVYGEEYKYFIPKDYDDQSYQVLESYIEKLKKVDGFQQWAIVKSKINEHLKEMQQRMITVRIPKRSNDKVVPQYSNHEELYGIRVLSDLDDYSFEKGIRLDSENQFI